MTHKGIISYFFINKLTFYPPFCIIHISEVIGSYKVFFFQGNLHAEFDYDISFSHPIEQSNCDKYKVMDEQTSMERV